MDLLTLNRMMNGMLLWSHLSASFNVGFFFSGLMALARFTPLLRPVLTVPGCYSIKPQN